MTDTFDIATLRRNLSAIMKRKDVKPTSLSLAIGKSSTLVKDLMEKTSDVKLSTIYKLADSLNVSVTELLLNHIEVADAGPRLFVKGEVAAEKWIEAVEWPEDEWVALNGRSDIVADIRHRFFLRVSGDSMDQIYPHGTFIECVSLFGHAEAMPGRRVVVVRKRDDLCLEATVKEMVDINGEIWLSPRSNNPAHQAFRIDDPGPGITEVRIIAVVVSSVRPE